MRLKKSASTGRLLKNSSGRLVNECPALFYKFSSCADDTEVAILAAANKPSDDFVFMDNGDCAEPVYLDGSDPGPATSPVPQVIETGATSCATLDVDDAFSEDFAAQLDQDKWNNELPDGTASNSSSYAEFSAGSWTGYGASDAAYPNTDYSAGISDLQLDPVPCLFGEFTIILDWAAKVNNPASNYFWDFIFTLVIGEQSGTGKQFEFQFYVANAVGYGLIRALRVRTSGTGASFNSWTEHKTYPPSTNESDTQDTDFTISRDDTDLISMSIGGTTEHSVSWSGELRKLQIRARRTGFSGGVSTAGQYLTLKELTITEP